jgi:hypothetical protein
MKREDLLGPVSVGFLAGAVESGWASDVEGTRWKLLLATILFAASCICRAIREHQPNGPAA